MLTTVNPADLAALPADNLSDELERGRIVYFPQSPIPLPTPDDLEFLRTELLVGLKLKNISYHPEVDRVLGLKADAETLQRVTRILKDFSN
ncbi:MAG TPA: Kdo hydroxylase family protein, partial [bacterium]|nr:Kdo hydroxylase family protein [bacterium]